MCVCVCVCVCGGGGGGVSLCVSFSTKLVSDYPSSVPLMYLHLYNLQMKMKTLATKVNVLMC